MHSIDPVGKESLYLQSLVQPRAVFAKMQWPLLIFMLILNDAAMTIFAFLLARIIRFEWALDIFRLDVVPDIEFYSRLVFTLIPLWILLFSLMGLYRRDNLLGGTKEYSLVFRATTYGFLLVIIVGFFEPTLIIARGWLLLAWGFGFLFISSGRLTIRRVIYRLRRHGYFVLPAILVGANDEAKLLAEQLTGWETSGLHLMGVIADGFDTGVKLWESVPVIGSLAEIEEVTNELGIREIIIATSALDRSAMLKIFRSFGVSNLINLRLSSGLFEIITTGLQVKEIAYVPLVSVDKVRMKGVDQGLKILLDYGLTIPLTLLLSPFLLLIAVLIKLDSPGSVIYRRRVMGLNGEQFDAYKFRTMHVASDEILDKFPDLKVKLANDHKIKSDPRITRLGKFLRKYSLDELLQLVNVLRGEMSLVGPRMISPPEMEKYGKWGINLLTVKPGITGLWQVSGRSDISYEERVRLDMYYIRNWTIWFDFYMLLQTISVVLKGRGAY